jgi:hypothetical protein
LDLLTPYTFNFLTTSNTVLSLIYTLYKSLGHAKSSQSSLVVSWQWIHNSLTVTAARYEVFFAQSNSFLAIILPTTNSGVSLSSLLQLTTPELNSNFSCVRSSLYSLGADPQKIPLPLLLRFDSLLQRCVYCTLA